MKKVILSIAAMACSMLASAQMIAGYNAVTSEGTYKELDNPTVVQTGVYAKDVVASSYLKNAARSNGYGKTVTGEGFEIGFTFPFNGEEFTHFGVYSHGGIKLGKTAEMTMGSYSASGGWLNASGVNFDNSIYFSDARARSYNAADGDTLQIQYQTVGEAGSRELILEFKDLALNKATNDSSTDLVGTYSMQIRLCEDGTIAIAMKGLSQLEDKTAGNMTLGIRGNTDYCSWGPSLANLTKKFNGTYTSSNAVKLVNVADGFTISITVPEDVVTPTTQPTDVSYTLTTSQNLIQTSVDFTPAENADRTLVVIYEGTPDANPVDGVVYKPFTYNTEGDMIGSGKVYLASDAKTISINKLKHSTKYTVVAYAYNCYGANGPKYNIVDPATITITTTPEKPKSVSLVGKTANSVTFNVEANEASDKVFVAYNTQPYFDNYAARGYIGEPDATLSAGDQLYIGEEKAGKVAYFGAAGQVTIDNLEASTPCYISIYSYNDDSKLFSCGDDSLHLHTSTIIIPTYELDCSTSPNGDIPAGWSTNKNKGYQIPRQGTGNVKAADGGRCFNATRDKNMALELKSPDILLPEESEVSFDYHMHAKGSGMMPGDIVYDEWEDEDELKFLLYIEGEDQPVVLQKYDVDHPAAFETKSSWNSFTADLSAYAGKTVKIGWSFKCVATVNVFFGMNNFKVLDTTATGITTSNSVKNSDNRIFNLQGQRVSKDAKGILIVNGRKVINK